MPSAGLLGETTEIIKLFGAESGKQRNSRGGGAVELVQCGLDLLVDLVAAVADMVAHAIHGFSPVRRQT